MNEEYLIQDNFLQQKSEEGWKMKKNGGFCF